ncbi:MAG: type II/IV secretion system protein [Gammaproteobacteria bacterium]|nr:MAG: type II/IV secretion system protein [Gammaproteobacteria bacterium]
MANRKTFIEILKDEELFIAEDIDKYEKESEEKDVSLSHLLVEKKLIEKTTMQSLLQRKKFDILIGDLLIETGVITKPSVVHAALKAQQQGSKKSVGQILEDVEVITHDELMDALCYQLDIIKILPEIELAHKIDPLPAKKFLIKNMVFPYFLTDGMVTLLMSDPFNHDLVEQMESFYKDYSLRVAYTPMSDLIVFLDFFEADGRLESRQFDANKTNDIDIIGHSNLEDKRSAAFDNADSIQILRLYMKKAIEMKASDIHFEPLEYSLRIRFAVDGILHVITHFPKSITNKVISAIKAAAGMDIASHRIPQDGGFAVKYKGKEFGLRVSTYPCIYGENCVIRLLSHDESLDSLDYLCMSPMNLHKFKKCLQTPSGIILACGPTGSGKSTTLYTALVQLIQAEEKHIITIEDPIEYTLKGATQGAVNEKSGFRYDTAMVSIMRQNPDVIMVGEVRDKKTADAIMKAALTGHKVFSTIHTETSTGTVDRLLEMGIDNYLMCGTMELVVAQRLVRRVCSACIEEYLPTEAQLASIGMTPSEGRQYIFRHGTGTINGGRCEKCNGTGYFGRVAIHEVLSVTSDVARAISDAKSLNDLRDVAKQRANLVTMKEDCVYKILKGITTIDECNRVIPGVSEPVRPAARVLELCESSFEPTPCQFSINSWGKDELLESINLSRSSASPEEDELLAELKQMGIEVKDLSLFNFRDVSSVALRRKDKCLLRAYLDSALHCTGKAKGNPRCERCKDKEAKIRPFIDRFDREVADVLIINDGETSYFIVRKMIGENLEWSTIAALINKDEENIKHVTE